MANKTKSGLDNLVKAVLGVGNQEQNLFWPPHIISSQVNTVTSLLLDKLVDDYPENQDMFLPFITKKKIPVTNGVVLLPDNYRNILGAPSISVRDDGTDCGQDPVVIDTEREFQIAQQKSGCKTRPVVIVDKKRWDYLVTSKYKAPTYTDPIGMFTGNEIKVCPYDLKTVEVTFCVNENIYKYGYIMQPDDTFIFDESTSVDTQWGDAAFSKLFTAMLALYSAWSRDNTLTDWSRILHNDGIL